MSAAQWRRTLRARLVSGASRDRSLAAWACLLAAIATTGCARHFVAEDPEDAGERRETGGAPDAAADVASDAAGITDGGVEDDCADYAFVVTSEHVLLASRDGLTWSVALEDPTLGHALAATHDRAFVTGANGYSWSREDGRWIPSTLPDPTVLTAAFEDDLVAVTADTAYVQREGLWEPTGIDFGGGRPIILSEGPHPSCSTPRWRRGPG